MTDNHAPVESGQKAEYPHIRKVGRYLFYVPCALGFGSLIGVALIKFGVLRDIAIPMANICSFAAFLALRDIEKNAEKRARVTPPQEPQP